MDYNVLFSWLNQLATAGWILLIFTPKRWNWVFIVTGIVIPTILGTAYGVLMLVNFASVEGGGYASLNQVRALFGSEPVLVAGWSHYLCFDLLVGTCIAYYADKVGILRLIQMPILLCTFMFGPMGLVLFFFCFGANYIIASTRSKS